MSLFGFIGVGNMGAAILKSCYKTFGKDDIVYFDASEEKRLEISNQLKIKPEDSNTAVVNKCRYLILAIKPQHITSVLEEVKEVLTPEHVVISIAVGVNIKSIKSILGDSTKVVRAMPNTPALISKGTTGVTFSSEDFSDDEKEIIDRFFHSFGEYEVFSENLMNAVTCACGSSPAYVYMFIEALADSVVSYGIPRDKAYSLAASTVLGSAAMVLETGEHPGVLKDQVCSPGGTTIAAVKALEENGFRNAIIKATDACYNKAVSMSEEK